MGSRGFGFVHHSRTLFCRAVPNPNITIRDFCIAVRGAAAGGGDVRRNADAEGEVRAGGLIRKRRRRRRRRRCCCVARGPGDLERETAPVKSPAPDQSKSRDVGLIGCQSVRRWLSSGYGGGGVRSPGAEMTGFLPRPVFLT
jgi:hypothetical protein